MTEQHAAARDDLPIPYELTPAAHRDLDHAADRDVVMSFADASVFSSAEIEAIAEAHDRGDHVEVERLHGGRPLLTPDPAPIRAFGDCATPAGPDALDRARAAVAALADLDECIRPGLTADDAESDTSVLS
ncbi:hypothetical protein [Pseudonocardia thermophila]|uniref:hypothetical protein n=1 Tax=Pseudonocardia thermophila TaxID=1848 RepID=UPI00248F0BC5|nr:hypothetical protein [Pseudonocardia thermophila]